MRQLLACAVLLMPMAATAMAAPAPAEWALASKDTEIRIGIRNGADAILSLHTAASPWEWVQTPNAQALPASAVQGGAARPLSWAFTGARQSPDHRELTLTFRNASPALELVSHWKASAGLGPIEHWAVLKNGSGDRLTIGAPASLSLPSLSLPEGHYVESTQVRRGGSNAQVSGGVLTRPVGQYWSVSVPSRPSDGGGSSGPLDYESQVPFLSLQVDGAHGLYVGWKFSAVGEIAGSCDGTTVKLTVGLTPDFKTDVLAGEKLLIPAGFIGTYRGDQAAGAYSMYRYVQDSLLPKRPPEEPYPSLIYGYYFDGTKPGTQTESDVLASARLAHELGFETFLADAMWFPETGDWRWDPKRFPRGAKPIADYLHANGMKFALWMGWTMAADSDAPGTLGFKQHPDWFTHPPTYEKEGGINWNAQIDVGNDDARRWVENETQRVVSENRIDYLKTDYSPIAVTSMARHSHGDSRTDTSYWSTLGYYRIQERLMERFPALRLESCSGGGTIKDFGDIEHAHYLVGTDTLSALADRQSIYDSSYVFPPGSMILYTYDRVYSDVSDAPEPYLWRSGMLGAWDLALTDSAKLTLEQKRRIRHASDLYKSWIRPVLADAHVHRILPRPDGSHWDGLFYWNAALGKGTAYVFRPNSGIAHQAVLLAGLDADRSYRVRAEDGSVSEGNRKGRALMTDGLDIRLPARFTSDLIYVEEAR